MSGEKRLGQKHTEESKAQISETCKETSHEWHVSKWPRDKAIRALKSMASMLDNNKLNSIEKALRKKNLGRDLFYKYWPNTRFKDDPEVLELIDNVRFAAEARAVEGGLGGTFNSAFTRFYLTNKFGFREQSDVNLTNAGGKFDETPKSVIVKLSQIPKSKLKEDDGAE